jgi:hypothetical protein
LGDVVTPFRFAFELQIALFGQHLSVFRADFLKDFGMRCTVEAVRRVTAQERDREPLYQFVPELFQLQRSFRFASGAQERHRFPKDRDTLMPDFRCCAGPRDSIPKGRIKSGRIGLALAHDCGQDFCRIQFNVTPALPGSSHIDLVSEQTRGDPLPMLRGCDDNGCLPSSQGGIQEFSHRLQEEPVLRIKLNAVSCDRGGLSKHEGLPRSMGAWASTVHHTGESS